LKYYLSILEYDKVLSLLGAYFKTAQGMRLLENIKIMDDIEKIRHEMSITLEARDFIIHETGFHFDETTEITDFLDAAVKQGFVLGADEILEVKRVLEIYISNHDTMKPLAEKYPLLWRYTGQANIPAPLLRQFDRIFDTSGSVSDKASPELARIRGRKKTIRGQIHGMLIRTMEHESLRDGVQERIITFREGRYVIPVKTAYKNRVNCIVHSFSKSGETVFIEPESVVVLNNEMMGIDEEEAAEIRRILRELTVQIGEYAADIAEIDRLLGLLEFVTVKARFAIEYRCGFPEIVADKWVVLRRAFHPLLSKNNDLVPIDIEVGKDYQGLVISGPNAGGKTVALKTVGLLTLMAMSGIPITASDDSEIGIFGKVMAEIGDEQSITRNLSTFSGHIVNLVKIMRECDDNSLILIDEITSATEPKEGEALGREIITSILDKGARFIVTTHYQGIKEIGFKDKRVYNAFVEFDEKNLKPLYHLFVGSPGNSFALKIAQRFGMDDRIIGNAETYLKEHFTESEKLIRNIETERNEVIQRNSELRNQLKEVELLKNEQTKIIENLRKEKEQLEIKGIAALKNDLDGLLKELAMAKGSLKKLKPDEPAARVTVKDAEGLAEEARKYLNASESEMLRKVKKPVDTISPGMTVYVRSFEKDGIVEEIIGDKVKIRIGIVSVTAERDELYIPETGTSPVPLFTHSRDLPRLEIILDVRGERTEEALKMIEKNVDVAWVQGVREFEVIHGKGEGILRRAIWEYLQDLPMVENIRYAKPEDGGQGKTIVSLKGG
jgi:DNA mismatch repair protein MutS2